MNVLLRQLKVSLSQMTSHFLYLASHSYLKQAYVNSHFTRHIKWILWAPKKERKKEIVLFLDVDSLPQMPKVSESTNICRKCNHKVM